MRSDEEFIAYVWEKYRLRQKKSEGKASEIVKEGTAEYQYHQANKTPHRRWIGWSAAAGVAVLAAAVIGGALFGPRIWTMGDRDSASAESSQAVSQETSATEQLGNDWEHTALALWYRRISDGYRPEGDCRPTVITGPQALETHMQAVDMEAQDSGRAVSDRKVQQNLSVLVSCRFPEDGEAGRIFDEEFFGRRDLLVIEYTGRWSFPLLQSYTLFSRQGKVTLDLNAFARMQTEESSYWQLFIPVPKGTLIRPEGFTLEIGRHSAVVQRMETGFLGTGEVLVTKPYLVGSFQELDELLNQWRQGAAGPVDTNAAERIAEWQAEYNEDFFREYDLVLFSLTEGSSSIYHQVDVRNPARPVIGRYVKQTGTDGDGKPIGYMLADLAGYAFFMEVPKGVLTSAEEIQIEVSKEIIIAEIG